MNSDRIKNPSAKEAAIEMLTDNLSNPITDIEDEELTSLFGLSKGYFLRIQKKYEENS